MRLWLLFFTATFSMQASAQQFDLERLKQESKRYVAPAGLRAHLAIEERKNLSSCVEDGRWELKRAEDFFGAVRVSLGARNETTYLAFATKLCPGYFGNGPGPYWIVQEVSGKFRTLLSATTEVVRICKSTSNGLRDIEEIAHGPEPEGDSVSLVRYDGKVYGYQPLARCSK